MRLYQGPSTNTAVVFLANNFTGGFFNQFESYGRPIDVLRACEVYFDCRVFERDEELDRRLEGWGRSGGWPHLRIGLGHGDYKCVRQD